jgi:hypothetical protein
MWKFEEIYCRGRGLAALPARLVMCVYTLALVSSVGQLELARVCVVKPSLPDQGAASLGAGSCPFMKDPMIGG